MIDTNQPEVYLLSWTNDPIRTIYAEIQMYDCKTPVTNLADIPMDKAMSGIKEALKSHLKGCLEKISLTFQLKNVPRAFTHQMVRTRIGASYAQQSMRFTNFTDFNYHLPSTIKDKDKPIYEKAMKQSFDAYTELIESGVSVQDARAVLPIATNTHIMVSYTFKTLVDMAEKRMCIQAQNFWPKVVGLMKKEIATKIHPFLADMLAPKCVKEGKCPYQSDLDRDCPIASHFKLQENKKKYIHKEEDTDIKEKIEIAQLIIGSKKFNPKN